MASIKLVNVTCRPETGCQIKNISLDIEDGQFVVLLGPSGAGKTTVLRCIAGLERLEEGEVYIGDGLANHLSPAERDVTFVFQSYALYPHMSVYDNLAFPLKAPGAPKVDVDKRVREVAHTLGIERLLERNPGLLSGGEMQRVALGRAMVRKAGVYLMDEPLSNLDAKLREHMRAELKHLQVTMGITMVSVTHDQIEALAMADRIAILKSGEIQQVGTPMEVYEQPVNTFVADFLGSPPMNMTEGRLTSGGQVIICDGLADIPIASHLAERIQEETEEGVVVGVRPEDIFICQEEEPTSLEVTLYGVERLGSKTIISWEQGETIWNATLPPDSPLKIGDRVRVGFDPEKAHLFHRATGEAIR